MQRIIQIQVVTRLNLCSFRIFYMLELSIIDDKPKVKLHKSDFWREKQNKL